METHRNTALIVLSASLIVAALPAAAYPGAKLPDVATDLAAACPVREESIDIGERPRLLAAVPTAITVTALAHHPARQLPAGTAFILSLDHLTLPAGMKTKSRRTAGPTLFLVQNGMLAVIDNGRPHHPAGRPGSGPGESVLVEQDRLVSLQNTGDEPGSVLLLGLLPPEGQLPIGAFPGVLSAPDPWVPLDGPREQLIHWQMLSGEIAGLPREETQLFATCLHWTDPASEIAPASYPGPVGLLVLSGQALINETERIVAGSCWLSPSYTTLRIQAGEQAPDIVLFGALRTSAQPQIGVNGSDASSSLDCAGPAITDDS